MATDFRQLCFEKALERVGDEREARSIADEAADRYEAEPPARGPWKRRSPAHPIASAANRLQSLEDHACEYDDEEIADVVGEIAEHFEADKFKEVARKFGLKTGQNKGEIVQLLVERICKAKEKSHDHVQAD